MPNKREFSQAYQAGFECIQFGPNNRNTHYRHFASPELMREWEVGSRDAETKRNRVIEQTALELKKDN